MKKHISIQKLGIAGLTAFGLSAGLVSAMGAASGAHAAELVTFTATVQPVDGSKGGNVEFGWKVEAGERAGTEDINIGVGELQETIITKTMDTTVPAGTFRLTFQGQTTSPDASVSSLNFESYKTDFSEYGRDGAKGGNVEFEWKVEEGES